jgi:hypothetical protein
VRMWSHRPLPFVTREWRPRAANSLVDDRTGGRELSCNIPSVLPSKVGAPIA